MFVTILNIRKKKKAIFLRGYTLYIHEDFMTKEREKMKLIVNEELDVNPTESTVNRVYQSNPLKSDLLSKLHAFRTSQKKFTIQDLIRDNLK